MNHEPSAMRHTSPALRYALCAVIIFLSATAVYALYPSFLSQVYFKRAGQFQKKGFSGLALNNIQKAAVYQPQDARVWNRLADIRFDMGMKKTSAREAFLFTQKAGEAYLKATRYNPLDAETAYGLARTESRLEQLYAFLHPDKKSNPYHPLPYYDRAIQLRPNGITNRYALARYLFQHDRKEALAKTVRAMTRMYPPVYHYLKKEFLWSPSVKEAVKQGLVDAIHQQHQIGSAHTVMSSLLASDKDWPDAIVHYQKALEFKEDDISAQDYIHLGRLYLENTQVEQANITFIKALYSSTSLEETFQTITHTYKNSNPIDKFYAFYQEVSRRFALSPGMHIISARCLIDQKQYSRAQQILMDLNQEAPTADAFYWLARIAEREKDWDAMELNIQKATVLDPINLNYRRIFYGLLKRLGKYKTAERQLGLMIENSNRPSSRLFDERARLRLNRKDYTGAVEDWKSAIVLLPKKASYYANVAEAYIKQGNFPQALEYYQKAVTLNPGNRAWADRYKKLKNERS